MELERILGTDKGREAFYKSDRNFQKIGGQINSLEASGMLSSLNVSGSILTTALSLPNNRFYYITTSAAATDLPAQEAKWLYATGLILKRSSEVKIILFAFNSPDVAYNYYYPNASTWNGWTVQQNKPSDWITATLQNGWTGTLQYRKNQIGQLEIKGSLTAGTVILNTVIATLPYGYRPLTYATPIYATNTSTGKFVGLGALIGNGELKTGNNGDIIATQAISINAVIPI